MEETLGQRINRMRADDAAETSPEVVATACPFCMTMLGDGIRDTLAIPASQSGRRIHAIET